MGFRSGAYATVWDVKPKTPNITQIRITISKKPRGSDEYVQDFSGFCSVIGATPAQAALALKQRDRIKLGDVEVTTQYVEEKDTTYTNYAIFSFEKVEENRQATATPQNSVEAQLDMVDNFDGSEEEGLPF